MGKTVGIIIIALTLIVGGVFLFNLISKKPVAVTPSPEAPSPSNSGPVTSISGYQGKVLAGKSSPFLEFNQSDFEKAKSDGKIILLDFYATWCPICRAEAPEIDSGFNSLTTDQVVGFRVNFNDPETDDSERALAKQFSIPYQHTKVIVKDGKEISRSSDSWTKDDLLTEINSALK